MKIGIMGGTFDPIHIGHLLLGEFAYENFQLDEIWFLPNGNPPHKTTDESGISLDDRIEMVRLATDDIPYFRLNLYEATSGKHSYTYARHIRSTAFSSYSELIHCSPSNSGRISRRFSRPAQSLQPCGMTRTQRA